MIKTGKIVGRLNTTKSRKYKREKKKTEQLYPKKKKN